MRLRKYHKAPVWRIVCLVVWLCICIVPVYATPTNHLPAASNATAVNKSLEALEAQLVHDKTKLLSYQTEYADWQTHRDHQDIADIEHLVLRLNLYVKDARASMNSLSLQYVNAQKNLSLIQSDIEELQERVDNMKYIGIHFGDDTKEDLARLQSQLDEKILEKTKQKSLLSVISSLQQSKGKQLSVLARWKQESQQYLKIREKALHLEAEETKQVTYQDALKAIEEETFALNDQRKEALSNGDAALSSTLTTKLFLQEAKENVVKTQLLLSNIQWQLLSIDKKFSDSQTISTLNRLIIQLHDLPNETMQLMRLIDQRISIVDAHIKLLQHAYEKNSLNQTLYQGITKTLNGYKKTLEDFKGNVVDISNDVSHLQTKIYKALHGEISERQGLLTLDITTWHTLIAQLKLLPILLLELFAQLFIDLAGAFVHLSWYGWIVLVVVEALWVMAFRASYHWMRHRMLALERIKKLSVNALLIMVKLVKRNLVDMAVIGGLFSLFFILSLPLHLFQFIIDLSLVWLGFKISITFFKLVLLENISHRSGKDVILYKQLYFTFIFGAVICALTVLVNYLPVQYVLADLFYRLIMLFLFIVSILLLRAWDVIPDLLRPHLDMKHPYLRRLIVFFSVFIPILMLLNALIGLAGYVNLVMTISKYEAYFILMLSLFLVLRYIFMEAMKRASEMVIRYVPNGWFWMEAVLKPFDALVQILLFIFSVVFLLILFGIERGSPFALKIKSLFYHHLFTVLDTDIITMSIIKLMIIVYVVYWLMRWSRELSYRWIFAKCKDASLRNSLSVFTQYTVVIIAFFAGLRFMNVEFSGIKFILGGLAVGVGFGLRDLANNFVSGILLLIERPVRLGDLVSIGGFEGEVAHIGFRSTMVSTWDHMDVYIPNAEIFSKSFTNWTRQDSIVRSVIILHIYRDDNPYQVKHLIEGVLASHTGVVEEPAFEVFMLEMDDARLEMHVRYYINLQKVRSRIAMRSEVMFAIWEVLKQHGIKLPFPQQDIHIKSLPEKENE